MKRILKSEQSGFGRRIKNILNKDGRSMLKSKRFYILIACALIVSILITVILSLQDETASEFSQTDE